jgi:hypothetical protein
LCVLRVPRRAVPNLAAFLDSQAGHVSCLNLESYECDRARRARRDALRVPRVREWGCFRTRCAALALT